ncbi:MAG: tetratricopeptide repeat protein [Deltaproteobacteria bacterium]|nr:tetratricopeptide repeat protein [Deltaproteobacteria bacterium]
MADFLQYLAILDSDPDDAAALAGLTSHAPGAAQDPGALAALADARKTLRERGRLEVVARLYDLEIGAVSEAARRADLLLEKGMLLEDELLDEPGAVECLRQVLTLRPGDETATETLQQIGLVRDNWEKFAGKYLDEAKGSTDRQLATSLYLSAAEIYARHRPASAEVEQYLRRALEVDPRNRRAALHLERVLRAAGRWAELAAFLEQRVESASSREERIAALLGLADAYRLHLGEPARALEQAKKVIAIDPAQAQAIRQLADAYEADENWHGLVALYSAALKARRGNEREDLGMLLQVGMVLWRRLGDLDAAEDYFRRIRKVDLGHPAALDFYRAYYPPRGEGAKLLQVLRQAEKAPLPPGTPPAAADARSRALAIEIAELAEASLGSPDKAIDAWKQMLRADPTSIEARRALERLYRKTEKWNALLDLMKEEVEKLPEADVRGRVGRLLDIVDIYRDRLKLDVMVINTYNTILKLDPDHRRALDELALKYKALGRWNDLIGVLTRKSELEDAPLAERVAILREVADLWSERFGNFAQAIRPLERILELAPEDQDAATRLKDIYTRRRQWRQLITLVEREAAVVDGEARRAKQVEMARLAAERLGDSRLAIEIYNTILAEAEQGDGAGADLTEALAALAGLYERDKRWLALAEILRRQREQVATPALAIPILERLGALFADRVGAPAQAAAVLREILDLDATHTKALRTLRELYAQAADYDGLEKLYGGLGQWDELIDALIAIADRMDDRTTRLAVLERAAGVAQRRIDESGRHGDGKKHDPGDRAARVWERVLGVDPQHAGAARALAPIYARAEKWSRLVPVLEIELTHATDLAERRRILSEIRTLCEQRLGSRALAFTWTLRAVDLDPDVPALAADLLRLAQEPEQWREVQATFDRHLGPATTLAPEHQLRLLREQARIAAARLHDPERARDYERRVLGLAPGDEVAEAHLEELAIQLHDWPELLGSYRRRAEQADADEKVALLFRAATIEEERLADLDAAAATYRQVLAIDPGSVRALHALAKVEEARGDWEGLDQVLDAELAIATDAEARFGLLMRLGGLELKSLDRPIAALSRYRSALAIPLPNGAARPAALEAVVTFLDGDGPAKAVALATRAEVARDLLPLFEKARDPQRVARALEVLRADAPAGAVALEYDRRLVALYSGELADPARAWDAAGRVHAAEPTDDRNRAALHRLAGTLGRHADLAARLSAGLTQAKASGAPAGQVRVLAAELAHVSSNELADPSAAERAWLAVLEAEPDAADAFGALAQLYRGAARWNDLRALLERRIAVTFDDRIRLAALVELAQLEEDVLGDPGRAIGAHNRILEIDPGALPSYKALERLYAEGQAWAELEQLLTREHDVAADKDQAQLYYRRAELRAHKLGDATGAVDLLEQVVARQRGHADGRELLEELLPQPALRLRIARMLEPLYLADHLWKDLVLVLGAQRELAVGPGEAVELLARIAAVEEQELATPRAAFDSWTQALLLDPTDARARQALPRLGAQLDRWPEVTAAWEKAAAATADHDVATRAALFAELGELYDLHLGDTEHATSAYERLLAADPHGSTAATAMTALARLYEENERWADLRAILRRQADNVDSTNVGARKALLARVAGLDEQRLASAAHAIETWREVAADDPDDRDALAALERLHQAGEQWPELVEVLRRKAELAGVPELAKVELRRIAEIHEIMLERPSDAIAAHLEILDHLPEDTETLAELSRLYRDGNRPVDLLDVLERRLAAADDNGAPIAERVALEAEIATLLAGPLERPAEALDRWARVLGRQGDHAVALAAVERALDDRDLRGRAVEILRPLYDSTGQDDKLAALLTRVATGADDVRERLTAWSDVALVRERRQGDLAGAFDARIHALEAAVAEPELPTALGEVERLAAQLGREGDLIDVYRRIAPDVLDGEIQRRLYLDVADLARAVRGDVALAREHYQKVIDAQPDDRRALHALESIYREGGEHGRLWEILSRKAELAGDDLDERVACLAEAAALSAGPLNRPDEAIAGWESVLELEPQRQDAVAALEALYRQGQRWHDLVDLHERRLGFAFTVEEAVALRVRLGEIHEKELHDANAAVDSYAAALGGDPANPQALAALERFLDDAAVRALAAEVLEPIYVQRQDWPRLARIWEIELDAAADPAERIRLTRQIARLYEEQLEDFEPAMRWYARLFEESPADPAARDQLHRLASILDHWAQLADIYQAHLADNPGDAPEIRDIALAAATIFDRRTGDVDRGQAAYRRALSIAAPSPASVPDDAELFRRLEALLVRAERWDTLVEVYAEAIAQAGSGQLERRLELHRKIAEIEEHKRRSPVRAIDAYRELAGLAATTTASAMGAAAYELAATELDRLYRAAGQWYDLTDLYQARIERATDAARIAELRLGLADVLERELKDATGAIEQHELVLADRHGRDRAIASLERLVVAPEHRERIAEILEPVYRANDWWQKLVVILDAKLAYIDDAPTKVATLREIATIHEARGGDPDLAFDALARAWKLDVADDSVFDALVHLGSRLAAWDELVATLEAGAGQSFDPDVSATILAKVAEIEEVQRGDHPAAIRAWRKVLEHRPEDPVALASLDRLLAVEGKADELVKVVERRAELAEDAGVRLVLLHRVASLYEEILERPRDAIGAYKAVLAVDDADLSALEALERLYGQVGEPRELAQILTRRLELVTEPQERRRLRLEAARIADTELRDPYDAIAQLTAVLDDDAGDAFALAELDRLYAREQMWPELLDVVDRRALLATAVGDRADLAFRAAGLVERELAEPDAAIPRYNAVLQIQSTHAPARAALERLTAIDDHLEAASAILERVYRAEGSVEPLVRLYERRLTVTANDPATRRDQWAALADIHEVLRADLASASATWARALAETPSDLELYAPLERLAAARGAWPELAALLETRLAAAAGDPELEYAYATRLASIYEDALGDLERAATTLRRAAAVASDERVPLAALDRVLARAGKWAELAVVLQQEADAAPDDARAAELYFRLGDLRETSLADVAGAVAAYREVLTRAPLHPAGRAALERLLGTAEAERADIIDTLEPLYEAESEWGRLADLLAAKLAVTRDHGERGAIYQRIAELAESRLGDNVRALDAVGGWLAEDPTSTEALAELDRLAAGLGRWGEAAARLGGIASSVDDIPTRLALLVHLGAIQLDRQGDTAAAAATYRAVLGLDPESMVALDALVRIHRQAGDRAGLADVQWQRAALAFDPTEKRRALVEAASLREQLGQAAAAITAWQAVLDLDDADRDALAHLAALHEQGSDWRALVDTLTQEARFADGPEEKRLKVRIAELHARLGDTSAAVAAWRDVADLDPNDDAALAQLEAAHAAAADWLAVQDVLTRRLDLARSKSDKLAIIERMAAIAIDQRGSVDDAIGHWFAALEIDNAHLPAYAHLEQLLTRGQRWHDLVELLERLAELHGTLGNSELELGALARAADTWEGPLDNPDAAGEILEKILRREPGSVAALTRLARIYERSADWDRATKVLGQALALGPKGKDAADLFFRLGEVAHRASGDLDTAQAHWRQALTHDGAHAPSIAALEKVARDRGDHAGLADLLARRVANAAPADRQALELELAELYRKLGRAEAAIPLLERAAAATPTDVRVIGPLADLYFAAGRLEAAAPLYDRLAEDAKAARRMKDVAKFRQRQGGILEARGDAAGALAAYEEAFRVNATDLPTMAGLGRIYMAQKDWEKARRVYRSLVLQTIDADVGVTKADVYWALGVIHVELNEAPKAKGMFQRGLELEPHNEKLKAALAALG